MSIENDIDNPERAAYYARYGIREIYYSGGAETERGSYTWVYEKQNQIEVMARTVFDFDNDEIDNLAVQCAPDTFLAGLGRVRLGDSISIESIVPAIEGQCTLHLSPQGIAINTQHIGGPVRRILFDKLFLDSFSVIENSEPRLRKGRDISLGPAERALISIVADTPNLMHSFSPREFEVLVGSFMTDLGFSRVHLSRFVRDGGYDLYGVYCEGDSQYTTIVEVKHYSSRKVGIEIVDRLNGVRDRERADKGVIFTSSAFSLDAQRHYAAKAQTIALVDFERLIELIEQCSGQWHKTPSDLWTLPRERVEGEPEFANRDAQQRFAHGRG